MHLEIIFFYVRRENIISRKIKIHYKISGSDQGNEEEIQKCNGGHKTLRDVSQGDGNRAEAGRSEDKPCKESEDAKAQK